MKRFITAIALMMGLVFSGTSTPAFAAELTTEEAEGFVRALAEEALETLALQNVSLEDREAEFRAILSDGFELRYIGLFVLDDYRKSATPEELEEYHELFSEFILQKYSALLSGYAGETFVVTGSRKSGSRYIIVEAEIQRAGPSIPTEWRVRHFGSTPKVIDIKVEGVSMVQSQRDEFKAILDREGMIGLLAVLRARTGMMSAEAP